MRALYLVTSCGSVNRFLNTRNLIGSIIDGMSPDTEPKNPISDLRDSDGIGYIYRQNTLRDDVQQIPDRTENADILTVGSPVMKGSSAVLFKHAFDVVNPDKLALLSKCGARDRHAPVIERQLRSIFAFFGALTLPTGVYTIEMDLNDGASVSPDIQDRIDLAKRSLGQIIMSSEHPAKRKWTPESARAA